MNTGSELLNRLRIHYVAPMRRASTSAWKWWIEELMQMLPENLRSHLGKSDRVVLLEPDAGQLTIARADDAATPLARIALDDADEHRDRNPVLRQIDGGVLVLPGARCLIKRITLPAATEENLRGVLEFEMDRETPFSADQVYFDAAIIGRSGRSKTIEVELVATPREYLDGLLPQVTRLGLSPTAVSARNRRGALIDVNLLPAHRRPRTRVVISALNKKLATAAGLLFLTAIILPIYHKRSIIAELTPRVEAAREAALEGSRIRDNIEKLHTAAQSLVERKSVQPTIIELLDETTRLVPDGTWLTEFAVDRDVLRLKGESSIAASLIDLFDQSQSFANPQFGAPVTRLRNSDRERFDLSAQWLEEDGS